jgi:hypothetical protein
MVLSISLYRRAYVGGDSLFYISCHYESYLYTTHPLQKQNKILSEGNKIFLNVGAAQYI